MVDEQPLSTMNVLREFILTDDGAMMCENCRALAMKTFHAIPIVQTHKFGDDLELCYNCITKLELEFNIDITDVIASGCISDYLNNPKHNGTKYVTINRKYTLQEDKNRSCDNCRKDFKTVFKMQPTKKTQAIHDNILLCASCIKLLKLEFDTDIDKILNTGDN